MGHLTRAPGTILILRALQLGDLLCTVPAFRALRAAFPEAQITLLGLPWAKSFASRFSSYLDGFIVFPGWPGLPEQEPRLGAIPGWMESIQQKTFDLVLQMQGSGSITNPLVALLGGKQTAGFYPPGQYRPNETFFSVYPEGEHEIRTWLRLIESLGIPSQGDNLEFPVLAEERRNFKQFITENHLEPGRYVCLHPGARFAGRRLAPDRFAALGDGLSHRGYRVVITGSAAEQEITGAVASRMKSPALDAAGQTDLGTLALLLSNARLLVSNDTGVSHLAAAFKAPSVILFTASNPERWQPLNRARHRAVLNSDQATPQEVMQVIDSLLQEERISEHEPI